MGDYKEIDTEQGVIVTNDVDLDPTFPTWVGNCNLPHERVSELLGQTQAQLFKKSWARINKYYTIYKTGAGFVPDSVRKDKAKFTYVHAKLRYKKVATLIDKQARFLFGESPDIDIEYDGDVITATDTTKSKVTQYQKMFSRICKKNKLDKQLMQAAKDCLVGERVACVINFNMEDGITIEFINSFRFIYETKNGDLNELSMFAAYTQIVDKETGEKSTKEKLYELVDIYDEDKNFVESQVYLTESIIPSSFDDEIRVLTDRELIEGMNSIPVVVITNDGLLEEQLGVSDVEKLKDYETLYSKLSNADLDALRLGMSPIKYTIDMTNQTTKDLPVGPGAYWDLTGNWTQNDGKASPKVGIIEQNNTYSEALDSSLERIESSMYNEFDIPNVTLSTLQGTITSGKALKAIYWGLIVRCKEKMLSWQPALERMAEIVIEGAKLFPNIAERYLDDETLDITIPYRVEVESNYPLPEDDAEEQELDMAKVINKVMSKKTFIKRWGKVSDEEADEELKQIILEQTASDIASEYAVNIFSDSTKYPSDNTEYEYEKYLYFTPRNAAQPEEPESVEVTEGE